QPDPNKKGILPRNKSFSLPWWCVIVAWILVIICFCVSIFFLWAYGIQFGNEKATKWVSSLIFSFLSSVMVVEPIKILCLAMVFSAVCKSADTADDADEDEEDPALEWDESYLQYPSRQKRESGKSSMQLPTPEQLEAARKQRQNETRMWSMFKEIFFYSVYLTIVVTLSYGDQD
ncbi:unnamed protein product, partial [Notodromas monacha]